MKGELGAAPDGETSPRRPKGPLPGRPPRGRSAEWPVVLTCAVRTCAVLTTAVLTSATALPSRVAAQDLWLRGATLIDPCGEVRDGGLLIEDGVIAASATPSADWSGPILGAEGRFVIPALRDLHVHSVVDVAPRRPPEMLGTPETLQRALRAGVVGVLDLFAIEQTILSLRDRQRSDPEAVPGAELFAAGPCLTAPGGHCTEYGIPTRTLSDPEDARRQIGELAARRPDVVKLVYEHVAESLRGKTFRPPRPTLDLATFEAAVAAAREHGLPTVVHIRSWRDVEEAARAGASAVTHLPGNEGPPSEELVALLAEHGTFVIPTLSVGDPVLVTEPQRLDDPLLQAIASPSLMVAYRELDPESEELAPVVRGLTAARRQRLESLRRLAEGGVPIVAGTDAGNPWVVQGWSLHRELESMVEAGLEPRQALAAATCVGGRLLGRAWGLEPGHEGSVLVLERSPLDDITATRAIVEVVQRGRLIEKTEVSGPGVKGDDERPGRRENPREEPGGGGDDGGRSGPR